MSTAEVKNPAKIVIGPVRFSYLHIFEPQAVKDSQEKKYSASLIIDKDDPVTKKKIDAAIAAAKEAGKAKLGGKIPANLKTPLRDGDVDRPEDEAYEGKLFINASAKNKPGVVNAQKEPIMSQDEIKSGDYGYASITFYAFNTSGNKGIAAGLNHLMKTKDGDALSGRTSADEDFASIEVDNDLL